MPEQSLDRIFITALAADTVIGVHEWERQTLQRVEVDLEMWMDLRAAGKSDAIEDTLNYRSVAKRVLVFLQQSRFQLVEALAGGIASLVLEEFGIERVRVTVHKPGAVRHSKDVGVTIERARGG